MLDVMGIDVTAVVTAGERAVAVARPERAFERRCNGAAFAPDVERRAVLVLDDRDEAPIACEPLDGIDRQVGSAEPSTEGGPFCEHGSSTEG
jgi:hypothetical protein